jgi:hypothetical protein
VSRQIQRRDILKTFILFLGLAGAAGSVHAGPILYTFNFTGGTITPTGSFDYDPSAITNPFSSFVILADGSTFDFTSLANGVTTTGCGGSTGPQSFFDAVIGETGAGCGSQQWLAALGPATSGGSLFILLNGTNFNLSNIISTGPSSGFETFGTFTATAAAPEPGTWALFLAGAGTLLSWKRIRRGR